MAKMNRKKALDAMVKAHTAIQTEVIIRFNAEGIDSSALFPQREEIVRKIMDGIAPEVAVNDAVDAAIRLHRIGRSANTNVPSFRDLMCAEDLELLKTL